MIASKLFSRIFSVFFDPILEVGFSLSSCLFVVQTSPGSISVLSFQCESVVRSGFSVSPVISLALWLYVR